MRNVITRSLAYFGGTGLGPFLMRAFAGSSTVQFAGMALTFLVGVQLARGLGVEGYGYYGIAVAIVALASIPGEFGLPKLVTREVAAAAAFQDSRRLFGILRWADRTCGVTTALTAVFLAIATLLILPPSSSPLTGAILLGVPLIPLAALARIRGTALQGLHHVVLGQVPVVVVRPLAFSLFLLCLFQLEEGATAADAMALNALAAAASLAIGDYWLRSRLPNKRPAHVIERRTWLSSAIPMAIGEGARVLHAQLGVIFLGVLASASEVGLFRIALSTATIVAVPIGLINVIIGPVLARLHADNDRSRIQRLCTRAAQAMTVTVLALTVPFIFWGSELISLVFGIEFAPALPALLVLCAGQIMHGALGPTAALLTMTGHERTVTGALALGLLVNLGLIFALVPIWGQFGAAVASAMGMLSWSYLLWVKGIRLLGVEASLVPRPRRLV